MLPFFLIGFVLTGLAHTATLNMKITIDGPTLTFDGSYSLLSCETFVSFRMKMYNKTFLESKPPNITRELIDRFSDQICIDKFLN